MVFRLGEIHYYMLGYPVHQHLRDFWLFSKEKTPYVEILGPRICLKYTPFSVKLWMSLVSYFH